MIREGKHMRRALRPTRVCAEVSVVRARQWPAGCARLYSGVGMEMVGKVEELEV